MKQTAWVAVGSLVGFVAVFGSQSCGSSEFTSCADTYTCAVGGQAGSAGTVGSAGDAGAAESAGGNGNAGGAGHAGASSNAGSSGNSTAGASGNSGASSGGEAGASATGGGGAIGGGGAGGDSTPPTVLSVSPADHATGIPSNATIQITFSETMNTASVSQFVSVSGFTSTMLGLSWDGTGTVLTVTATGGFPYATGTTLASTTANDYALSIGTGATDLAGNALAAFNSSFTTLRKISQVIPSGTADYYSTYDNGLGYGPSPCPEVDSLYVKIWSVAGVSSGTAYNFMPFDTSALGDPTKITSIQSATLVATQNAPTGSFYSLHTVVLDKLQYQAIDNTVLSAPVTDNIGTFASSAVANPSLSVLTALKSDLASGITQSLYRLGPTGPVDMSVNPQYGPDMTTIANFTCNGFSLNVVFLEP
ncbi:MAG TPA: Ig-like domain-containing protein [Polyangiaceae bacterium]|jgi:hypothetical protein